MEERSKVNEKVKKVVEELLKEVDFDLEELLETDPKEMEALAFEIALSLSIDEKPKFEFARMVERDVLEKIMDENGNFIPN
jgi:hypothetical protein